MGKRWSIKAYTFEWWDFQSDYYVYQSTLDSYLLSAKLKMTLGDTSKLTFSLPYNAATEIKPIVTLVEVRYGENNSWERKFFGTVTKKTKTAPDGIYKYEAVGVLGSYQFLPNYSSYDDSVTVQDLLGIEANRFRGQYTEGTTYYTPSAWEKVYAGHNEVPANFGKLNVDSATGMKFSCNLESYQHNAKNAYEFIKAITKDGCYTLPTNSSWFRWFEYGEQAYFKAVSGTNTQAIRYDTNLSSCTIEESPYYTYVDAYTNSGGSYVRNTRSGNGYPNPFYSARIQIADKADGTTYSLSEVQNFVNNELADNKNIVEATGFDLHVVDDTIPWLDMGKFVNLVYYENYQEQTVPMQIAEITYDLCDSSKDRVKLGKIQQTLTDTMATNSALGDVVREYLPLTGGTMSGDINWDKTESNVNTKESISNGRIKLEYSNSSPSSPGHANASIDINVDDSNEARIIIQNEYINAYGEKRTEYVMRNALGELGTYSKYNANNQRENWNWHNFAGSSLALRSINDLTGDDYRTDYSANGFSMRDAVGEFASFKPNGIKLRDRIFGTCNLIDMASLERGAWSDAMAFSSSTNRLASNIIEVSADTTYTLSMTSQYGAVFLNVKEWNSSKTIVRDDNASGSTFTFTTSSTTKYIAVHIHYSNNSTILPSEIYTLQLEKGSSASSYVPYAMDNVELTERVSYKVNYFTPQNCSARDVFGNCFYFKENGMVHIHIGANNPTGLNTLYQIGQLPSDCYPLGYAAVLGHEGSELLVSDTGLMRFVAKSTDIIIDLVFKAKN